MSFAIFLRGRGQICGLGMLLLGLFFWATASWAAEVISAGLNHTCGVKADGGIVCWGYNGQGQAEQPTGSFTQVSAGQSHTCGLKTDGSIVCWGANDFGQATPPSGSFTQVEASVFHTCGIKTDGSIVCWGGNNVSKDYGYDQTASPSGGGFIQISAGITYTCGLKVGGSVECWGKEKAGKTLTPPVWNFTQISVGKERACGVKTNSDVECWPAGGSSADQPPIGSFVQVSMSNYIACGLKTNGSIECWPAYGLASSKMIPPTGNFVQLSVGLLNTGTGLSYACGLKTDGSVECWGSNNFQGQATPPADVRFALPDANTTTVTPPTPTATYEEGLQAGKQLCIDNPATCGIQMPDTAALTETVKQQCANDPASCGIVTPTLDTETLTQTVKQQCASDPVSCGIQTTCEANTSGIMGSCMQVVYDTITKILSIPMINVSVKADNVESIEPFEAQLQLNSVDANGTIKFDVARLNPVNQPLPDILPEHPALDKALELTQLYLTHKNKAGAADILGKIQQFDNLMDFLNGINQHSDNPVKQVLFALEFYLKTSKYIFGGGLVQDGTLVAAYDAIESHFDPLSEITGKTENFYIRLKESRSDAEVKIHQVTYYYYSLESGPPGKYVFSENNTTYTGKYIGWAYGYSFKSIESGLYVAEISVDGKTFIKPVFVKLESNQTATLLLD